MNRLLTLLELLVLVGLIALLISVVGRGTNEPVNALLGDQGFVALYGHAPTSQTPDSLRIGAHLTYVEGQLRRRPVNHLTPELRARRTHLLNLLRTYTQVGRFPGNYRYPGERRPCFIDSTGAICAVGYLVAQTAGRAVAEAINAKHQYDLITDMHLPELHRWVAQSGLTLEECAMIQPSYNYPGPPIYQTEKNLATGYALGSGALAAANLTLGVLNGQQLRAGTGASVVPWLGLASGLGSVALGLTNPPRGYEFQYTTIDGRSSDLVVCPCSRQTQDLYTRNPVRNTVSWINMGVGVASTALSVWNLLHKRPNAYERNVPRTRYSFAPLPGSGAVVQVSRTF